MPTKKGRPTVNEILLSRSILHATFVERFKDSITRDVTKLLNSEVIPALLQQISNTRLTVKARRRLNNLLLTTKGIVTAGFKDITSATTDLLKEFSVSEAVFQQRLLKQAMPIGFDFDLPSPAILRSIVTSQPMRGEILKDWFLKQSRVMQSRIEQQIRIGLAAGETTQQISQRFRGLASVFNADRRGTQAIVRTAVNHVTTQAKEEVYKENTDVIKGVQWISTLDSKTTDICAGLDGQTFPVGEGQRPPAHFACRSTTAPITKSFEEIGIRGLKEIPEGSRASQSARFTGQVPARQTYGTWLKKQPVQVQNKVLGVGRAKLFRSGKVKIDKFTTSQQRSITLKELQKKEGQKVVVKKQISKPTISGKIIDPEVKTVVQPSAEKKLKPISSEKLKKLKLTTNENNALLDYSKDNFEDINGFLRTQKLRFTAPSGKQISISRNAINAQVKNLDNALNKMPKFSGTTHRSFKLTDKEFTNFVRKHSVGGIIKDQAYTSSSIRSRGISGKGKNTVNMRIIDNRGIDISRFSLNPLEREVLFPRNTKFLIKEISLGDFGQLEIVLIKP